MPPKKKARGIEWAGHGQQEPRGPRETGRRQSPDNPRLLRFVRNSQVALQEPGPSQRHCFPGTLAGQETGTCMSSFTKLSLVNREFSSYSIKQCLAKSEN